MLEQSSPPQTITDRADRTHAEYTPAKAITDLGVASDVFMSRLVASLPSAHTIDVGQAQDHVDHYFDQFSTENAPLGRKLRTLLVKWMRLMADTDREGRNALYDGLIKTHDVELKRQVADHIADRVWDAMTLVRNRMGDIAAEHGNEPTFDDLAQAIETLGAETEKAE